MCTLIAQDKGLIVPKLRARMKPIVYSPKPRLQDVRVNLRRRKIRVPEHRLDSAQVGAVLEQVRGERMPKDVRAERARQPRLPSVRLEDLPEPHSAQRP